MLAKDREQRFASCGELMRELYRIQVEYCPLATPEELASWGPLGMEPLSDPRLRAKRQLAAAMHELPRRRGAVGRWLLAAGMVLTFAASAAAAWFTMRPRLLSGAPHSEKSDIPRQDSELRQWFQASRIGTVDAWKSVIEYPNVSELVALRAKQHLARLYLFAKDPDHAIAVCDELASTSDSNAEFKAFGLAGKAVALSLQGKYQQSAKVLEQLEQCRKSLRDADMRSMVRKSIEENNKHLEELTPDELKEWLSNQFGTGG